MFKSIADIKNKRVLIMGLGTKGGGVESARFAHKHSSDITITDLKPKESLMDSLALIQDIPKQLILGEHRQADFQNHDIIIKNPGIKDSNKFIQTALKNNKIVECPIGIFSELIDKPFIGITGTKGKSFTTNLVNHILSWYGLNSVAAGNNCVSPLSYLGQRQIFVLELSSWQLRELNKHKKSPNVACWLNFFEDHLNFYDDTNEYFADKNNILKYQNKDDFCVLPLKETRISNINTKSKKIVYTVEDIDEKNVPKCFIFCKTNKNFIVLKQDCKQINLFPVNELNRNFLIPHHFELVIASICIAYIYLNKFYDIDIKGNKLLEAINSFPGLEHRFEHLNMNSDITVINDSAASTPESVILALKACSNLPVTLILGGGGHKNLSFINLAGYIAQNQVYTILFNRDKTSELVLKLFNNLNYKNYTIVNTLQEATQTGYKRAIKDNGTLLLSSGCSGAPFFIDMFERGRLFKKHINKLIYGN